MSLSRSQTAPRTLERRGRQQISALAATPAAATTPVGQQWPMLSRQARRRRDGQRRRARTEKKKVIGVIPTAPVSACASTMTSSEPLDMNADARIERANQAVETQERADKGETARAYDRKKDPPS